MPRSKLARIIRWAFASANNPKWLNQALWLLTFVGLLLRVIAVLVLNDYRNPLTAEYGVVAANLVAGKGFVGGGWLGPEMPTALNTPLYPLFLAGWLWIGGPLPFLGVEISQAILSALLIYLFGKIGAQIVEPATGLLSGLLLTFYPPLIYFCKQVSPAVFTTFFTGLSFYCLVLFFSSPTWKRAMIAGFVWGISLLVEPILLLAVPGTALIAWVWRSKRIELLPKLVIGALLGFLVILPWTIRNYLVFHRLVLLKTSFGLNLWLGNNPNATGFLYTASGEPMQNTLPPDMLAYLESLNEAERYAVLQREAWEWIQSNPAQFLRLTLKRIGYLWLMSPTYKVTTQNIVEPRYFYVIRNVIQIALLILAFMGGIIVYRRNQAFLWISLWWITAFTVPYAVSVAGNTRYRLPVEPILVILSGTFFREVLLKWQRNQYVMPNSLGPRKAMDLQKGR